MTGGGDPLFAMRPATPVPDLERLYVAHHRRLRSLAASITFDRSIADEIVHDAFAAAREVLRARGIEPFTNDPAA